MWDQEKLNLLSSELKAHKGSILSLANSKDSLRLYSGASDGLVIVWEKEQKLKKIFTIDLQDKLVQSVGWKVTSLAEFANGLFVVGLRGGEIVEYKNRVPKVLVRGHS